MAENTYPLNIAPVTLEITGTVTIPASSTGPAPTQRGLDAVHDLGLDPTGQQDCALALKDYLDEASNAEIHFPPGRYHFAFCVETNAKGVKLVGDGALQNMGDSPVIFSSDQPLSALLWWNGSQSNSNMNGPRIENIQFQDSSPNHNVLRSAIRLTATANSELEIGFLNMRPKRYTTGTVAATTNSKTVTGSGTDWHSSMASCSWIVIDGYPYEVVEVTSPTSLTLAIGYQGSSGSGKVYGLNWGGVGVWLEPGTDFTQYGKNWSLNGRIACALFASTGSTEPKYTGTSRIKVNSGYLNGEGVADSMAGYFGPFSDTFVWNVAMNSYACGVVIANGHQHDLQHMDCENAGGPPPVSGKPVQYNSCHGILVMGDNSSDTWGNRIGGYFRQVGTAIELYGHSAAEAPTQTVIGVCTFRSNKAAFVNGNATATQGFIPSTQTREPVPWWVRLWRWLMCLFDAPA